MIDTPDLFEPAPRRPARAPRTARSSAEYSAKHIEVLEGLEAVRHHPAMYIGGIDEAAMHHLFAEVLDNAMDEAVAGHATRIEVELAADGTATVRDNGRGIPVDSHPKFKKLSALEVILTTLHAGAKFSDKVYHTAGGLHGVGVSVVNALSERLSVEVARDKRLWTQSYRRGKPAGPLEDGGAISNRRGTTVTFRPDPAIFGEAAALRPGRLYRMARSKAYLFRGVEIRWSCDESLLPEGDETPARATLRFPGGLADFLAASIGDRETATPTSFAGQTSLADGAGTVEWAVAWPLDGESFLNSYCNTVPTPQGGTHEAGLRAALAKGLRAYGELVGNKRTAQITADDVAGSASAVLSVFLREPQFQGQTKEKLVTPAASRLVEGTLKDHFDHWLGADPESANALLALVMERSEERLRRRRENEVARKSATTRRLRLPGKLTDCSRSDASGTEIFLVEGDSAGGSAKQARNRETQAVLPLRGKILNVASATPEKVRANQELNDLALALGCGTGARCSPAALRYERVIIMTDADVDGAHIAALLMTFFWREMPGLIEGGRVYLAVPPLYRLSQGGVTRYARDDAERDALLETGFPGGGKVEISRFKGLGEMPAAQLKTTTMDPASRILLRIEVPADARERTDERVESLMGRRPEPRFAFIQENAHFAAHLDV